MVILGLLESA